MMGGVLTIEDSKLVYKKIQEIEASIKALRTVLMMPACIVDVETCI